VLRLRERNSVRSGRAWAESEIWSGSATQARTAASYRAQTVEIPTGPKGAFENGGDSTVTRRVAAERVRSAVPRPSRPPKTPSRTVSDLAGEVLKLSPVRTALSGLRSAERLANAAREFSGSDALTTACTWRVVRRRAGRESPVVFTCLAEVRGVELNPGVGVPPKLRWGSHAVSRWTSGRRGAILCAGSGAGFKSMGATGWMAIDGYDTEEAV
jgi:hypothetical protein